VKITLLESSLGAGGNQILASYLVNDSISLDAGSVGFMTPLDVQRAVKHIFVSHTHIDHLASLPIFVDNTYVPGPDCVTIHGSQIVLDCLQQDIFNDRIWPDMIRLSGEETPFLRLSELKSEQPVKVGDVTITPVLLDHIVPAMGFIAQDDHSAIAIVSDTGPTERIWEVINATENIKAVFLEASFPNNMTWLAEKAMHLTPEMFKAEKAKLKHDVPVIAIHIKAAFDAAIRAELLDLKMPNMQFGQPGKTYDFD
jgi:cAMP phosphodiesterase